MAKNKTHDVQPKDKIFTSTDEISQSISKLRARIHQVEELKRDGLPYRDALRVTAEYQLRDSIREIFGERSPEYLQNQNLRIKVNSKQSVNETISLLQHLVVSLEERRLDLLGLRSPASHQTMGKGSEKSAPAQSEDSSAAEPTADEPSPVSAAVPLPPTPTPEIKMIQPVHPMRPPEPARVAPTAEVQPPVAELPVMAATPAMPPPPIMLVSQGKLKLSAQAPESPLRSTCDPLRFQAELAPPDVSDTQPSLERSMSTKLRYPPSDAASEFIEPQRTVISSDRGRNNDGVAGHSSAPASTSSDEDRDTDTIAYLRKVCSAFHRVARQLRQRRDERPTLEVEDERDVVDLLHALLSIQFDNIEPEEWAPTYASGSTRTDLWLKEAGVVIIAKKTKQGIGVKALTHQVSVDFERYGNHPDCRLMFCFIYDPEGRIGHPKGLEGDLTVNYNGRRVEALISPK
ncbi:PD-(D/E)XK nuclease domain-containing protein [Nitrospira sp. Nam74]